MTKQHIWPDWLGRNSTLPTFIAPNSKESNQQTLSSALQVSRFSSNPNEFLLKVDAPKVIVRQGHPGARKLRMVCQQCNNTWMNNIENSSKEIIISLINLQCSELNKIQQLNLVSWLTLMTIVFEYTDIQSRAISYKERKYFLENKLPPEGWSIWIGRYQGNRWKQRIKHSAFNLSAKAVDDQVLVRDANAQTTTLVVGGLFAHISSTNQLDRADYINDYAYKSLIQIWPIQKDEAALYKLDLISDREEEAEKISERLNHKVLISQVENIKNEEAPE